MTDWALVRASVERAARSAGWGDEMAPFVVEYVAAWQDVEAARVEIAARPYSAPTASGRVYASPAYKRLDVSVRRAMRLGALLGLTPAARRRLGLQPERPEVDEFAGLVG